MDLSSFNGEGASYKVLYKSQYDSVDADWRNATVSNPKSRFYILERLEAYTTYNVTVVSVNRRYESERSNSSSARTVEYGKRAWLTAVVGNRVRMLINSVDFLSCNKSDVDVLFLFGKSWH